MKMCCPVCCREVSTTKGGLIRRHGFRKDRWTTDGVKVDGKPCAGSGRTGLTIKESQPIINKLNDRFK